MIREALLHLPGVGPEKEKALRRMGLGSWDRLRERMADAFPSAAARAKVEACLRDCETAHARSDLGFFAETLAPRDRWRVLSDYFDQASYFDIETDGGDYSAQITLIACLHRGAMHTFVRGENLDDFPRLLAEIELLVSFNGASFDVPFVLRHFALPRLPCAHVDLRWIGRHQGYRGGLKAIEVRLGMARADELVGVDGLEAIRLWERWRRYRDDQARERLIRYCEADVRSLPVIAARFIQSENPAFVFDFAGAGGY